MLDTHTTEASEEKIPPDRERSVIQLGVSPQGRPVRSVEGLRI